MTRSRHRGGLTLAIVLTTVSLAVSGPPSNADTYFLGPAPKAKHSHGPLDTTVTITVHPLKPGVYAAKVSFVWTGWVELPDGILMVDTGFSEACAKALADTVRARSGPKPFRYVVNTHQHEDHTGGDRYFAALGATFVVQEKVADEVQHLLAWPSGEWGDSLSRLGVTPVVKRIARRATFGGPKRPVEVMWLGRPAHTAGDLIVYLPRQRVLFAGDILSDRAVPWLLDPGMRVDGWLKSIDSLLTPAFAIDSLVPGHGEMGKPLEAFQFTNHYLIDAREKASAAAAWGIRLNQVRDWGYLGAYEGLEFYEEVHFMNMKRLYNEAKGIKTPGRRNVRAFKRI